MGKDTDLLIAARDGNVLTVKKLLTAKKSVLKGPLSVRFPTRKADVNCKDAKNGETPLHNAALNEHLPIVELLLQNGASVNLTDNKGCNPLHLAAWNGNHDIATALVTASTAAPDINAKNVDGDTPLCVASQYGHTSVAKLLLQHKADPTLRNNKGESALDLATLYGRLDTVCCLIDSCPDLLLQGSLHHTPLHLSARNGHKDVVRQLLQAGFNINAKTVAGTALHEAALFGKPDVVRLLLASGIDYNETDGNGKTILEQLETHRSQSSIATKQIIEDYMEELKRRHEISAVAENNALVLGRNEDTGVYDAPALYKNVEPDVCRSSSVEGIYDTPSSHYHDRSCTDDADSKKAAIDRGASAADDCSMDDDIYDCPRRLTAESERHQRAENNCSSIVRQLPEGEQCLPPDGPCPAQDRPNFMPQPAEARAMPSVLSQPTSGPSKPPRKKSDRDVKPLALTADEQQPSVAATTCSPGEYVELRQPQPWAGRGTITAGHQWECSADVGDRGGVGGGSSCSGGAQPADGGAFTSPALAADVGAEGCMRISVPCKMEGKMSSASAGCLSTATASSGVGALTAETSGLSAGSYELLIGDSTSPMNLGCARSSLPDCSTPTENAVVASDSHGNPFFGLRKGSTGLFLQQNKRTRDSRTLRRSQRSRTIAVLRQRNSQARSTYGSTMQPQLRQQLQQPVDALEAGATAADCSSATSQTDPSITVEDEYEEWKQIATVVSSYGGRLSISLSLGTESDFGKLFSEMENIKGVGDWLAGFGMAQYENVLIANGFDNTDFLGGNVLEEADLNMMGITNTTHVASILSHCCQLTLAAQMNLWSNSNLLDPSSQTSSSADSIYSSVSEWLESLQLSQYADVFAEHGLSTMDRVLQLPELQLSSILGIALRGHQKRILASLKHVKDSLAASRLHSWDSGYVSTGRTRSCGKGGRQSDSRLAAGQVASLSQAVVCDTADPTSILFDRTASPVTPSSCRGAPEDDVAVFERRCEPAAAAGSPGIPKRNEKLPSPNLATFVFVPVSPVGCEDVFTTAQPSAAAGFGSASAERANAGSDSGTLTSPALSLPRPAPRRTGNQCSDTLSSATVPKPAAASTPGNVHLSVGQASALLLTTTTATGSQAPGASVDPPVVGPTSGVAAQLENGKDANASGVDERTTVHFPGSSEAAPALCTSASGNSQSCDVTSYSLTKEPPTSSVCANDVATQALLDLGFPEDAAMSELYEQCQWRHRPELLIKGCVSYSVVYLGTSAMLKADGIEATKDAIDSIKAATSSLPNSPTVTLSISYKGVKFINASSKEVVCEHDIGNIYCVSQHADAMNFFAYSTKDHLSRKLYCHIFCVKSVELAREIILTLGEAFEVAYYASPRSTDSAADEESRAAVAGLAPQ